MYQVKPPGVNSVQNRYQPNVSHLYKANSSQNKPALPSTKPPIRSHIPTKMNLEPSVVNKFLMAVNGNASAEGQIAKTYTSQHSINVPSALPVNHQIISEPTNRFVEKKVVTGVNGNGTPHWINKSTDTETCAKRTVTPPWAKKESDPPKPTWNAKSLERPKAVWNVRNQNTEIKSENKIEVPSNPEWMTSKVGTGDTNWRSKYEDADRKRKELLAETQKSEREKANLERKLHKLENDYRQLEAEHQEKVKNLAKLSQVSKKVYQDYDKLNNKYEVETTALHKALGIASRWYMENKKLKRASIAQGTHAPSPIDETDSEDSHELDELRKNVQELSQQVGQLQAELNRVKLQEFEAEEQNASLSEQLDDERNNSQKLQKELKELRLMREKFESVTVMVQGEVESLRQQRDNALEELCTLQSEAHHAKTERNVLAHQSSLLMGDITPDDRFFKVLLEVEDLKRRLEDEEHKHAMEIRSLRESIDNRETETQIELLEEKLNLAESELQLALERAEQAERSLDDLKEKGKCLDEGLKSNPPCAPPPPPPPPPMPAAFGGNNLPLRKPVHHPTEGDSLADMARLLGIQRGPKPVTPPGGNIDNIINEIKGGKFTLKATEKVQNKKEEQPAAVQEMLSIIGTLKRRPKQSRPSLADAQL